MPTLPLYVPPRGSANAWHRVTAPGGYEVWRFEAEDERAGLRILISFFQGDFSVANYQSRYKRYLRRPTRNVPPVPAEYPSVHVAVYDQGEHISRSDTGYRCDEFSASDERAEVRIGRNALRVGSDGSYQLHLEEPQPEHGHSPTGRTSRTTVRGELIFKPTFTHPPVEVTPVSRTSAGADHQWIIAAPHCVVTGSLVLESAGSSSREFALQGLGYHDHSYGTAPIGSREWGHLTGRVIFDDKTIAFGTTSPREPSASVESVVIVADATGMRPTPGATVSATWTDRGRGQKGMLPSELRVGGGLSLTRGKLVGVDVSRSVLTAWILYEAEENQRRSKALCRLTRT